ncbi:cytochrome P450 [Nocardioides mangrovicus]|uniref:Cytochrome P450 n=1 Tax=Nocardioides mangrovicus TaxID=2478913 RepID=A0A3L8NYN1_9ACTN|nr:cytochrome P450 [Nocardioides mangrovicus]RLV47469.1 cytochrome P450 [Nocardioides mangrovicus]
MSASEVQIEFDHHSPEFAADSERRFPRLRTVPAALSWSESYGGFWVATSYDLARAVIADQEHFTVERSADGTKGGKLIPTSAKAPAIVPGILDGEAHDRLRRPLRSLFAKAHVDRVVQPTVTALVESFLDEVVDCEEFDFTQRFSFRLTVNTIFEFVGLVEVPDRERFILMLEDAFAIDPEAGGDRDRIAQAAAAEFAAASEMVRAAVRSRVAAPREDLLSKMVDPSTQLSEDDVVALTLSIILGGVRTTAAALENVVEHLARHPELRTELIEDPELIPSAVEDMLRLFAITPLVARTVTQDLELGGQHLKRGDRIAALIATANLDEEQFPVPLEVEPERQDGMHLTFGMGTHYCMGLWLARLELRTAVVGILQRMPDYEIGAGARRFGKLGVNNGFATLPIRPNLA